MTTPSPTPVVPVSTWSTWLKRPEVYAFIVALIVSALAWLAHLIHLRITDQQLNATAVSFWLAFVGFVFEGRYRGANYAKDFSDFLKSLKFQAAFVGLLVVIINAALAWAGIMLEPGLIQAVSLAVYAVIVGKTTIDSIGVATQPTPSLSLSVPDTLKQLPAEVLAAILEVNGVATSQPTDAYTKQL